MKLIISVLAVLAVVATAVAASPGSGRLDDWRAIEDSLGQIHPRLRSRWLNERGLELPGINAPLAASPCSDSGGLRMVGKFGRGPSVEVTGRDSLVFLSLGSEVAIINMADPDNPEVLSEPQAMGLVTQAAVRDSFLYIGCVTGQAGIEVWNVQDPANPVFRSRAPSLLSDFCISDTFLYLTQSNSGLNDTFKVYSTADPENVRLLGSCRDSGDVVTYTNNTAFLGDRWGLYSIDVSDPSSPEHIGAWGSDVMGVAARGNLCAVALGNPSQPSSLRLQVLDVSEPSQMLLLGSLDSAGGSSMHFDRSLLLASGFNQGVHEFEVYSVADSTSPVRLGGLATPGPNFGVWGDSSGGASYVADGYEGLSAIDIGDPVNPLLITRPLTAGQSEDISISADIAYIANDQAGLRVVDVSDATKPRQVGGLDSVYAGLSVHSAVGRDSFAYSGWYSLLLRTVDVADPANPVWAGECHLFRTPEDMVLRDSFLYVAEDYRFQVVNVARPRQPQVVGTCNLPDYSYEMMLEDSLAYVANGSGGLSIVNVAQPTAPAVIGGLTFPNPAVGVTVRDSFAYVGAKHLRIVNVARPSTPYVVDTVPLSIYGRTLTFDDTLLYVGTCLGYSGDLRLFSISDPVRPRQTGFCQTPVGVNRVVVSGQYVYACCSDAGVAVLETMMTGISESQKPPTDVRPASRLRPNPTGGVVALGLPANREAVSLVRVYDATGRVVLSVAGREARTAQEVNLGELPPGLYFVEVTAAEVRYRGKVVKQ